MMSGVQYQHRSRTNGWTLPPHPLQFVAWFAVVYFAFVYFTTLVPALPREWHPAGYIITGLALAAHVASHIIASTINPADPQVLKKQNGGDSPSYDPDKHQHVIENMHCYLCEADVGSKSKHCSACNKCISDFDHHCKWLNNCVGGRNYKWFMAVLVTGMIGVFLVFLVDIVEFITYFTDKDHGNVLLPYIDYHASLSNTNSSVNDSGSIKAEFKIVHQPVVDEGWLALISITGLLLLCALILLVHLFLFHIYLITKGLSTYDYIIMQREKEEGRHFKEDPISYRKRKRMNRIMPSKTRQAKEKSDSPSKEINTLKKENYNNYQEMLDEDERRMDGETPPPSASPIHQVEFNNNSEKQFDESTSVRKVKKKKKKVRKPPNSQSLPMDDVEMSISTIDNPMLYSARGFRASLEMPITEPVKIQSPPRMDVVGSGKAEDYNSDSAESLAEVTTDKLVSKSLQSSLVLKSTDLDHDSGVDNSIGSQDSLRKSAKKSKKKKSKNKKNQEDLNATTMFTVNQNAKFNADGSLNYSEGFNKLPLTPITLRKRPEEVPPLNLDALRGSTESMSFKPYSGSRSLSDTYRTSDPYRADRMLGVVPETSTLDTEL